MAYRLGRSSPWHDRATIAYPVTHHSVPTVQVSHEDDVDNWLRQADLHSLPVLHADCISNDEAVWKYEDPFASNVMPMMPPPQEYVVFADADSSVPASAHMVTYDAYLSKRWLPHPLWWAGAALERLGSSPQRFSRKMCPKVQLIKLHSGFVSLFLPFLSRKVASDGLTSILTPVLLILLLASVTLGSKKKNL